MDDAAAMGFCHGGAELSCDGESVLGRTPAVQGEVSREGLAFEKLHGQEIDLAPWGLRRMDFVDHANIGMTHFERAFEFRRKGAAESEFGGLNADALAALAIERLVYYAHATLTDFTDNFEAAGNDLARVKGPVHLGTGDKRFAQEVAHALFPIDGFGDFLEEFEVALAFALQENATLGRGPLEGSREKAHHTLVL